MIDIPHDFEGIVNTLPLHNMWLKIKHMCERLKPGPFSSSSVLGTRLLTIVIPNAYLCVLVLDVERLWSQ